MYTRGSFNFYKPIPMIGDTNYDLELLLCVVDAHVTSISLFLLLHFTDPPNLQRGTLDEKY
jgi:hypothetical protein